jgi:hypothetical protein
MKMLEERAALCEQVGVKEVPYLIRAGRLANEIVDRSGTDTMI